MSDIGQSEMTAGVAIGSLIAGKYRVDGVLGSGGMGIVLKATHLELREPVAIKILLEEVSRHPEASTRFLREARAAARLRSPHVAKSHDVGTLECGRRYMVMEYLQGADLASLLTQRGPLPVNLAVEYLLQACDAVAEAHQLGIIHRDLKPANLFVVPQTDGSSQIKVLDFGISKATDLQSSRNTGLLTRSQSMIGTPVYASPEQLLSAADVDARTDIWSLGGVVLYELLTGSPPFSGKSIEELVARVVSWTPPLPSSVRCDVPPQLERIVMACLERDRERRFASIADLVEALATVAGNDIGAESQFLASRIVRRHRSSVPPNGLAPTQPLPRTGNTPFTPPFALADHHRTPSHSTAIPETRASATNCQPTDNTSATNAGLYSSRPYRVAKARKGLMTLIGISAVTVIGVGFGLAKWSLSPSNPSMDVPRAASAVLAASPITQLSSVPATDSSLHPDPSAPTIELAPSASVQSAPPKLETPTPSIPGQQRVVASLPPSRLHRGPVSEPTPAQPSIAAKSQPSSVTPAQPPQSSRDITDFGPRR